MIWNQEQGNRIQQQNLFLKKAWNSNNLHVLFFYTTTHYDSTTQQLACTWDYQQNLNQKNQKLDYSFLSLYAQTLIQSEKDS